MSGAHPRGVAAIDYIIRQVEAKAQLRGKVTISHAFVLAALDDAMVVDIAQRLAA